MKLNVRNLVQTALTVVLLSSVGAYAQGHGGNAGGAQNNERAAMQNDRTAAQNDNRGAVASELKSGNAAHASAQAFMNVNPESTVGNLAEYKDARQAVMNAYEDAGISPNASYQARDMFMIEGRIQAVKVALEGLVKTSPTYTEDHDKLVASLTSLEAELVLAAALAREADAIYMVGADTLSSEALMALLGMINE